MATDASPASTDRPSTSERRRRRRKAAVEAVVEREMTDTRWDRLRTRRARRSLVIAWLAVTLTIAALWVIDLVGYLGLLVLPVWIIVFYALRRSVRALADTPDEYLDERQIAVRDRVYLHAYRIFATGVLVVLFALAVVVDRHTLTYEDMSGVMWLGIGISMGLPSAVLAWNTSDT